MKDFFEQNLNNIIEQTKNCLNNEELESEFEKVEVKFYNSNVKNVLKTIAPSLKVGLICTQEKFIKEEYQLLDEIKANGNKVVNYVVNDDFSLSIKNVCGLFNFAEDIRAVIVSERSLVSTALYFATIRQIPAIIICDGFLEDVFSDTVCVEKEKGVDLFRVNADRHIILRRIKESNVYAGLLTMQFSGLENQIFGIFNDNRRDLEDFWDKGNVCDVDNSIEQFVKAGAYNIYSGGKLLKDSCFSCCNYLLKGRLTFERFTLMCRLLMGDIEKKKASKYPPDYNKLCKQIVFLTNENNTQVVSRLSKQLKKLNDKEQILRSCGKLLCENCTSIKKGLDKFISTYSMEGEKEKKLTKEEKAVLYNCGNLDRINSATYLREI